MPATLALSIARAESGRPDPATGRVRPWPWTINADGAGSYFATKEDAIAAVAALQARGVTSIDVGCMQVNLRHHPRAFASLHEAFDPLANARYAIRFLLTLHRQTRDWVQATAFYHTQTPSLGEGYVRRVLGPGIRFMRAAPVLQPDLDELQDLAEADDAPPMPAPDPNAVELGVPGLACPVGRC